MHPESALALAARLRRREVSAAEVTRQHFETVFRTNPDIAAFVELDERRARRAAEEADRRLAEGGPLPLFLGVPSGIKDHEHMAWNGTRVGARALSWLRWPVDGVLAKRCREGGLVLFGKLSTSELTILPFIDVPLHAPTRNPLDRAHYAGGSSGGSAAAVAAGMLPIAPGSDGAGSIRLPASFCGLFGFKPGRGVLLHEHAVADPVEITAVGPLSRTVRDGAALMDVIAGRPLHSDTPLPGTFLDACEQRPRPLRIRVGLQSPLAKVTPEVEVVVRHAAKKLVEMGHSVDEGGPFEGSADEFLPMMARMVASVPIPPFLEGLLQPTTRWMREIGRVIPRSEVFRVRDTLERRVLKWFGDADVWLLPTSPELPPRVGQFDHLDGEGVFRAIVPLGAFTAPFNLTGQPAATLPGGRSETGLSIGVQLVGRRGLDRQLLALCARLEEALQ